MQSNVPHIGIKIFIKLNSFIQGVLALFEFHYCEFHYCDFSKKIQSYLTYGNFGLFYFINAIFWGKNNQKNALMKQNSTKFALGKSQ